MYLNKRVHAFKYAGKGIRIALREEANFRFQVACAIVAVALGLVLHLSRVEWVAVALSIALVLSAEALNTALEEFCDMVKGKHDPHVAKIKDLAAGAVLIVSVGAVAVGLLVFVPHLLTFFYGR